MQEVCFRDYMHAAAALDIHYWAYTALPPNAYQNEVTVPAAGLAALVSHVMHG
jgi:hypothetical protein